MARNQAPPHPTIAVVGDVAVDWFQVVEPEKPLRIVPKGGGALLVADLLTRHGITVCTYDQGFLKTARPQYGLSSFLQAQKFRASRSSDESDEKPTTPYRITKLVGISQQTVEPLVREPFNQSTDWVVIFDSKIAGGGPSFRDDKASWLPILNEASRANIVIRTDSPEDNILLAYLVEHHEQRLLIVVNVEDLRRIGIEISRGLSWESTAADIFTQLRSNDKLTQLRRAKHVVIRLGLDGAIHYFDDHGTQRCDLYYIHNSIEGEYEEEFCGRMSGYRSVFCAALTSELATHKSAGKTFSTTESIRYAIMNGLAATRRFLALGYNSEMQIPNVLTRFNEDTTAIAVGSIPNRREPKDLMPGAWSFAYARSQKEQLELARNIVVKGSIQSDIPIVNYCALTSVDRQEIENYRNVRNVMRQYLNSNSTKPLPLAVFGDPGSGKSFGVTEVSRSLRNSASISFNISQFNSPTDLSNCFHEIRDIGLKSGASAPLAFFDEFDAINGETPYGWLRYFLTPMQDGRFFDRGREYSIGRVIFIFAGGTCPNFEDFRRKAEGHTTAKGKDFISRLRGYVNVMGVNEASNSDSGFKLRRAVIIRSIVERQFSNLLHGNDGQTKEMDIDLGVLNGLLSTKEYCHGARSIQALFEMSALSNKQGFTRSDLPVREQMGMHVDVASFMQLVDSSTVGGA
jgi:hypothetical protein